MPKLTTKQLEQLVKEKYRLVDLLRKINPDQNYSVGQSCYCPFHENYNTPSAAIYEDGHWQSLYCFSEKRLYTSVDVMKDLLNYDIHELGYYLWNKMSEEEQQVWLSNNEEQKLTDAFSKGSNKADSRELEKAIAIFKKKKISLNDLLEIYIRR